MRASFNKWWLLPLGILSASALLASIIVVSGASFVGHSSIEAVSERAASGSTETSKVTVNCSGASATDYACHQERYRDLVHDSGVEAAFAELKDDYQKNDFVRANCHQLTHVIGSAAADLYGDVSSTFSRGDHFCFAGYYHGAMEAFVARIGADEIREEADTFCTGLREHQKHSFSHYDCAHGLGHGFMGVLGNDLFESLKACDALTDRWEQNPCYAGVFMENMMARDDPNHPSKYLKADRPLYPCTDVEARYKSDCYRIQIGYALKTQGNDFAKVFGLCTAVEDDFRSACYQGLGGYASVESIQQNSTGSSQTSSASALCMLSEDYEARSNCVVGAAKNFIYYHHDDAQAKAFCEPFDADLRTSCLQAGEEFYEGFQI